MFYIKSTTRGFPIYLDVRGQKATEMHVYYVAAVLY
jgi:hypothetical protein